MARRRKTQEEENLIEIDGEIEGTEEGEVLEDEKIFEEVVSNQSSTFVAVDNTSDVIPAVVEPKIEEPIKKVITGKIIISTNKFTIVKSLDSEQNYTLPPYLGKVGSVIKYEY